MNTFCLPAVHQRRRLDWILTAVLMNEVPKVDEEVCCLWHPVIRPGGEMELAHRVALWCVGLKRYTLKKKTGFRGQQQGFLPRPGQSSASPEVPVTSCAVIWAVTFQFPSFFCSGREYFEVIPFTFHFTSRPSLLPYICWQTGLIAQPSRCYSTSTSVGAGLGLADTRFSGAMRDSHEQAGLCWQISLWHRELSYWQLRPNAGYGTKPLLWEARACKHTHTHISITGISLGVTRSVKDFKSGFWQTSDQYIPSLKVK